jgi:hypothetical protein
LGAHTFQILYTEMITHGQFCIEDVKGQFYK